MPRYVLRPNADVKSDWTEDPVGTAWSVLDDSVEAPTAPTTGSDRITVASTGKTSAQGVGTFTLGGSERVVAARAWVYGKATAVVGQNYTVQLYDGAGAAALANTGYTSASFGWQSATYIGSLTQAKIDALEVRIISVGGSALEADAAYIEIVTEQLTGVAKTLYDAIKALSPDLLWVPSASGTVVPDLSGNFYHGDMVGSAAASGTPLLTGGHGKVTMDQSVASGIRSRGYKPYTAGSAKAFLAVMIWTAWKTLLRTGTFESSMATVPEAGF